MKIENFKRKLLRIDKKGFTKHSFATDVLNMGVRMCYIIGMTDKDILFEVKDTLKEEKKLEKLK